MAFSGAQQANMIPDGGLSQAVIVHNFNGADNTPTSATPVSSWRSGQTADATIQVAPVQNNNTLKAQH
jgi:hypothetical protein